MSKRSNIRFLIGVDDTDDLSSRGTGYLARRLGERLRRAGIGVEGITRHQLFVDSRIRYTSHNSSLCLAIGGEGVELQKVVEFCCSFLRLESAADSDAGLCIASWAAVSPSVRWFGRQAKGEIVDPALAFELSRAAGIRLEVVTGDGSGIIGALAAVGLRFAGNDGRFVWLPGLRELRGVHTAEQVLRMAWFDAIRTLAGTSVAAHDRIDVGLWPRPILRDGKAILFVEESTDDAGTDWRVVGREVIKRLSD